MNQLDAFLEETWESLLSRDAKRILKTYQELDPGSRQVVLNHLKKMTSESGWHPEQVTSASAALTVISTLTQEKK